MNQPRYLAYDFGPFRLLPAERQLLRDGELIALPPKSFDTLVILVQNCGHALKKDELLKQVWPDAFVEETNLNHCISVLRKALGDQGNNIETVRGYGFRFKGEVLTSGDEAELRAWHKHTHTRVVFTAEDIQAESTTHVETLTTSRRKPLAIALAVLTVGVISVTYFAYLRPRVQMAHVMQQMGSSHPYKEDGAAREAYLRGRFFWNKRTTANIVDAEKEFQNALRIDPNFAPAYAGLADCYLMGVGGSLPSESAESLALRALKIDDSLAEAHASLAYYKSALQWDWAGAEIEFQRAIQLDPQYPTAHHWQAYNLVAMGRLPEALAEIRTAEVLDPVSLIIKTDVGHILYLSHRYDEAIAQYQEVLGMDAGFRVEHWRLGEAYTQVHRFDDAQTEFNRAMALDSEKDSVVEVWLGYMDGVAGNRQAALEIAHRLEPNAELRNNCYSVALIYAGLGDKDGAFQWLNMAFKLHDSKLTLVKVEPMLDNLHDDPRYEQLLRQMNLL